MSTSIDFVLEGLDHSILMSELGVLESISSELITISGDTVATIDIAKTDIKKVFRFISNSNDLDDADLDDILYFVKMNNWPENLIINAAHAIIEPSNATYDIYPDERNMVKHDFLRHIAEHLFGSEKAVDLITNEPYLTYDIAKQTHENSWKYIKETLDNAFNSPIQEYYTNADSNAPNNYTKQFLVQLINYFPERLSRLDSIMNNEYNSIPFEDGDSISFKTILYPNPTQHNLTGVDPIPPKSYHIKMRVKDDALVNKTEPTDPTFVRTTDYNKSYNYTTGYVEFIMPVISDFLTQSTDNTFTLLINSNTLNRTVLRVNVFNSSGTVLTEFENLFIDISDEGRSAEVNILELENDTLTNYETTNNIHQYKIEFVTNDDLDGEAFDTYLIGNKSTNYQITQL